MPSPMISTDVIESENKQITKQYKELLRICYQMLSPKDKKQIRLAFDTAIKAHEGQRRKSGEPYIFHPIAVAKIVASEIGMDAVSISSALLHDVVEDTSYSLSDIKKLFGSSVANIVDGLTKITNLQSDGFNKSSQIENFKKILTSLTVDIRVSIIKIADRLHNMTTMDSMPAHKQKKIASETLYIYAPIAHRLGLYNIKNELEDLSLKYINTIAYNDIENRIKESQSQQKHYIENFITIIKNHLDVNRIKYQVKGRPKTIYSIHQKMITKNIPFEDVYDKFAIRIIYKSKKSDERFIAWKIYSIISENFEPNPERTKDWITFPRSTGYEALHTTVMGPEGKWVEIQIRSERMNEIAERGYAAHFKYKQKNSFEGLDEWLERVKEITTNCDHSAIELVQQMKMNLYESEVLVFTPTGETKRLPSGASPLDFAFLIHSEIGLKTKAAKVNKKLVPLNYKLKAADQVEIITSDDSKPKFSWLEHVKTVRAKTLIKSSLKEQEQVNINIGKDILRRKFFLLKIFIEETEIKRLLKYFKLNNENELFYRVKTKAITNDMLREYAKVSKKSFISNIRNTVKKYRNYRKNSSETDTINRDEVVFGKDEEKLSYSMASCCNPIHGDKIFGFTTIYDGIKVHKRDCENAISLYSNYEYRILSAKWLDDFSKNVFTTEIGISGIDNLGLVSEITKLITRNLNVDMNSISFKAEGNYFNGKISVEIKNNTELQKLIQSLKSIDGVDKIKRY